MTSTLSTALGVGLATLRANPLRSVLSTLGVVIGVASLVAVLAVGDGMERFALRSIEDEGLQTVVVEPVAGERVDGVFIDRAPAIALATADAVQLAGRLPAGSDVSLRATGAGLVSAGAGRARGTQLVGVLPPARGTSGLAAAHGRLLTADDARRAARVAVLSAGLADSLAAPRPGASLLGGTVRFSTGATFAVVGILAADGAAGTRNLAMLPVDLLAEARAPSARGFAAPAAMHVTAASVDGVAAVQRAVESWAASRWPGKRAELTIKTAFSGERVEQVRRAVLAFKLFMGAVVGISLVVGGIGIMNVLLASVSERTREIGIRKTTGARGRDILHQFLAESVVITSAGAALGVAIGLAAAFGITALVRTLAEVPVHAALSASTFLIAIGVSVATGLVFGTYPARRAARLSPIEAIRHE